MGAAVGANEFLLAGIPLALATAFGADVPFQRAHLRRHPAPLGKRGGHALSRQFDRRAVLVRKLERGVRALGGDLAHTLPLLRYLLAVDPGDQSVLAMDPRRRQDAIIEASRLLLERGTQLRPHVIVLEDMHWCDPATEDWMARLADGIGAQRVLVLMTYRPGYRPAFVPGRGHTMLALSTL